MSGIVEAVAMAIEKALVDGAGGGEYAYSNGGGNVTVDYDVDTISLARAAIEAYEKAKRDTPDTYKVSIPGDADYTVTWSDYDKPDGPKVNIVREP